MSTDLTELMHRMSHGSLEASDGLIRAVYADLRAMAQSRLSHEGQPTLQATELVHEAWLRLGKTRPQQPVTLEPALWENRGHFFAAAAESMRRILVDRARARTSLKRGGTATRLSLDAGMDVATAEQADPELLVALDEAVACLELENEQAARVVKLRFFVGLSVQESAALLEVDERTVIRKWKFAQAWLFRWLQERQATAAAPEPIVP